MKEYQDQAWTVEVQRHAPPDAPPEPVPLRVGGARYLWHGSRNYVSLDPASFTDAGTADTHTASIDWGDGTALDVGVVTESPSGPAGCQVPKYIE